MVSYNSSSKEKTPCRLTFGSLTTLGVLKVASTEALEVVTVKALGGDKAKAQRALGLAVKGKTLIRREAMVYVHFGNLLDQGWQRNIAFEEKLYFMLPYDRA